METRKHSRATYVARIAVFSLVSMAFGVCVSGCRNLRAHVEDRPTEHAGMYRGTRDCSGWIWAAFAPASGGYIYGKIFAIALLPFSLLDWPFEVVADTITFPYDFCVWAISDYDVKLQRDREGDAGTNKGSDPTLVQNPIPLFVKRIGRKVPTGWSKDIFPKGSDTLRFDFMKGDFLPPVGNGVVADVEFVRLPHQDFGEGVNAGGYKGKSYRNSMEVRFTGEDNGIVEVARPSSSARLKVRTAPETGFNPRHLCWHGRDKHLKYESNRDEGKCFCFRIRTRRNERGEIVEGYYGKIYGEIFFCGEHKEDKTYIPVASVSMLYYLNPNNLDRNLEWNKQNLCEDPIYPIPPKSRRQEYKSFNREQAP